jgi:hypothetical protein
MDIKYINCYGVMFFPLDEPRLCYYNAFFLFFYEMVTKIAMRSNDFTLVPVITLTQRICFPEVTMPLLQFGRQVTLFPGSRQGLILYCKSC